MNDTPNALHTLEAPAPAGPAGAPTRTLPGSLGRVMQGLPTLIVLCMLGGLAYWGHHTGWAMPTFAALTGGKAAEEDDWCAEHGVPESECVECNPKRFPPPKDHGWCRTHGVHACPLDHPDLAQLSPTPRITAADRERAERGLKFAPRPENDRQCKLHTHRIQFASQKAVDKAGLDAEPARIAPVEETVTANGEITYDPTLVATLASPAPGRVWRVVKEVGQPVCRGEVLALVDAAEVGKAKGELLQALARLELKERAVKRLRPLAGQAVATAQFQEAEADLREARARLVSAEQALVNLGLPPDADALRGLTPEEVGRRLQFLGLPQTISRDLDRRTTTANLVPVKASLDGVVVGRSVSAGEMVDPSKNLFVVADTRRLWLTLAVRLEDARLLKRGQEVRFRPNGDPEPVAGTVAWLSTAADEKTRTVKVRADLANPDGRLRAHVFGSGTVVLRREPEAVVVPNEAVHWDGHCHVVFVRDRDYLKPGAPKVFHVRSVRPGVRGEKATEIFAGLLPLEVVATRNSGVLRAELLRNDLGEG